MKITLLALGSRGDVQPFLALGLGLQQAGYAVTIAAGQDFASWIVNNGLNFQPFAVNLHELLQEQTNKQWIENNGGNPFAQMRGLRHLIDQISGTLVADIEHMISGTDIVISNAMTYPIVDSLNEKNTFLHINAAVHPVTPTSDYLSTLMYIRQQRSVTNRIGGYLFLWGVWYAFKNLIDELRHDKNLNPIGRGEFFRRWNKARILYAVSPLVLPTASDWDENKIVSGYWFLDDETYWQPPQELQDFLESGDSPVYVGFGSMSSVNPKATTQLIIQALKQTGQRGIISKGWAGLEANHLPDSIFMIDDVPHNWLFPRMKAIVHHGGSGTTASALRAGRPQTIVAHGVDQPFFGRRLPELGVGTPFIHRPNLTIERLVKAINGMVDNQSMETRAQQIAGEIRKEEGVAVAIKQIEHWAKSSALI